MEGTGRAVCLTYHAQIRLGGDPCFPHTSVTVLRKRHLVIVLNFIDDSNCSVANLYVSSRGRVVSLSHGNRDILSGAGAYCRFDGRVLGGGLSGVDDGAELLLVVAVAMA